MAPAQSPIQNHLRCTLAILGGHLLNDRFLSQIVSFGAHFAPEATQRTVSHWLDLEVGQKLDKIWLGAGGIQTDLVGEGLVSCIGQNISQNLSVKV